MKEKSDEEILKFRMYELAVSKILVYTLNISQFILIKAHADLGEAYLNFGCNE